jgi:hypothetical protein
MSGWLAEAKAGELAKTLESKGIAGFPGDVKLPI